uniref:Envelope glycoprotein n=1 Tax=Erpetoichthys calabaricus TaxID=27687 RepID=A0A8C4XF18_ERPCA
MSVFQVQQMLKIGVAVGVWCFLTHGPNDWGYVPHKAMTHDLKYRFSIIKGHTNSACDSGECNPLIITLKDPSPHDTGTYILGAYVSGKDPLGKFNLIVTDPPLNISPNISASTTSNTPPSNTTNTDKPITHLSYLNITTLSSTFSIETGYGDQNRWLQWILYSARQVNQSDCYACATARPHLATTPFPLTNLSDPTGFPCLLYLFTTPSPIHTKCNTLHTLFPPVPPMTSPMFRPYLGAYTCFLRVSSNKTAIPLGAPPPPYCSVTYNVSIDPTPNSSLPADISITWFTSQVTARADVWWMCRRSKLLDILPPDWTGACTLVQLVMPFRLLPLHGQQPSPTPHPHRIRRSLVSLANFSLHGPGVYIDSIGVPRGVPNKFKARDQVAAGFESIFPLITINKNVDWINYLYYNQQRFLNFTKEAIAGIHEQLNKTSLMTWQNRLALDMLLAEKGGVCAMFGDTCCTYIPNNTAPDGSITRALAGLTALSLELSQNSGIDTPLDEWFASWFGPWAHLFKSVCISLAIGLLLLLLTLCCIVPLVRHLVSRLFSNTMAKAFLLHEERTLVYDPENVSL